MIIFDLDGTLVNTYGVIRKTLIEVINLHLPHLEYDEKFLESFFGPPLIESFNKFTSDEKEKLFLISEYRRINKKYFEKEIKLYPGVQDILKTLSDNYILAIFSNRIRSLIDVALKSTGIYQYFDCILGVDNVDRPKPYPDGIKKILKKYKQKNAIYVGDTTTDIQTAKNANIISVGVTWSLTTVDEFKRANADYIANNCEELLKILEGINV